jgi:hypothetical protein
MSTLDDLQTKMDSDDQAAKQAATKTLADYYYVYNVEYNTLLKSKHRADAELFTSTHNPAGMDMPTVLQLRSMILGLDSRMVKLDQKMVAFHDSTLSIQPPDDATIRNVKTLSEKVAQEQVKGSAIDRIIDSLAQIAQLTAKIQGA